MMATLRFSPSAASRTLSPIRSRAACSCRPALISVCAGLSCGTSTILLLRFDQFLRLRAVREPALEQQAVTARRVQVAERPFDLDPQPQALRRLRRHGQVALVETACGQRLAGPVTQL